MYICTWNKNAWDRGRIQIFDAAGRFLTGLVGDAQQLSTWAEMTVAANTDYLKRRREVHSTEPEWTFAQPAPGRVRRREQPSPGGGHAAQPHSNIQQVLRLPGAPDESLGTGLTGRSAAARPVNGASSGGLEGTHNIPCVPVPLLGLRCLAPRGRSPHHLHPPRWWGRTAPGSPPAASAEHSWRADGHDAACWAASRDALERRGGREDGLPAAGNLLESGKMPVHLTKE